jgi:hypothetical protein
MGEIKTFLSDKKLTRLEYLRRIGFLILGIVGAYAISLLKFSNKDSNSTFVLLTFLFIGGVLLITIITSRIITEIAIDRQSNKFIVRYVTITTTGNCMKIPLHSMTFKFSKKPAFRNPKKWQLTVFDNSRRAFSIETGNDGFSQTTLEELAQELGNLRVVK